MKSANAGQSIGVRVSDPKPYITPAPGTYDAEKGEKYLSEKPAHSIGLKLQDPKKYITPAPGTYDAEKGEKYLSEHISHSMGVRLNDAKKYLTPAPNVYNTSGLTSKGKVKKENYLQQNFILLFQISLCFVFSLS